MLAHDKTIEQLASEIKRILKRNERILTPSSLHALIAEPCHLDRTSIVP